MLCSSRLRLLGVRVYAFGDNLCVVKVPAALEMQPRSRGLGTAEVFNRRSAGLDVIHESSGQDKEIKALWSQRDGLLCI